MADEKGKKKRPMAIITKVTVRFGRKVQVRQYEPEEYMEEVEAEIPPGCSTTITIANLREGLVKNVDDFFLQRQKEEAPDFETADQLAKKRGVGK